MMALNPILILWDSENGLIHHLKNVGLQNVSELVKQSLHAIILRSWSDVVKQDRPRRIQRKERKRFEVIFHFCCFKPDVGNFVLAKISLMWLQ